MLEVIGHISFVGEGLLVPAQGYCVHLGTWVNLDSHSLHTILHGEHQVGVEGDLSNLHVLCKEGTFFWIAGGLRTVGWGWC